MTTTTMTTTTTTTTVRTVGKVKGNIFFFRLYCNMNCTILFQINKQTSNFQVRLISNIHISITVE